MNLWFRKHSIASTIPTKIGKYKDTEHRPNIAPGTCNNRSVPSRKKKKEGKITWKADVCWALLRSGASEWVPSRSCGEIQVSGGCLVHLPKTREKERFLSGRVERAQALCSTLGLDSPLPCSVRSWAPDSPLQGVSFSIKTLRGGGALVILLLIAALEIKFCWDGSRPKH